LVGGEDFINYDITAPGAVSDLTALRGLDKVTLGWTNPGEGETALEVWRAVWYHYTVGPDTVSAYPEYDDWTDDAIPALPADRNATALDPYWERVNSALGTSHIDAVPARGIYYYVVYPVDGAGNWGPGTDVSSISYLLGDVAGVGDGAVTGGDITILALCYGTVDGPLPYNADCDVGPTDDFSGAGIPLTDNVINFDDLMIFALNWDVTVTKMPPSAGSAVARLVWQKVDDTTWALVLAEPCLNLKGINLQLEVPQGAQPVVTAGDLLGQQDSPYFLQNIPRRGLDAGLAVLGNGACIAGQGELVRISLSGGFDPADIVITARDAANDALEYTLEETSAVPDLPTAYALSANYPNPFNPMTKIDFALPEPQNVRLAVFGIDGRRIATLIDESMPAGHHTVTWMGRDDQGALVASGIYFYRIEAGDFRQIQKMTLLK
jgi:hypothetical protein